MPAKNIVELRALLAERFPGLRTRVDEPRPGAHQLHASGLPQIDQPLHGGFPKGALSEIIVAQPNSGSSTLLRALLEHAAGLRQIAALIDSTDSFNATQCGENVLARLLWIRCHSVVEAIRSADLVLRDSNFPLVLLDLKAGPENQLRKISAATWYRFQRLVEVTGATCLIFTPRRMVAPAQTRISLRSCFSLAALEQAPDDLPRKLVMEVSETGRPGTGKFSHFKA